MSPTTKLFVVPNNSSVIWPTGSLESCILSASKKPSEIGSIISKCCWPAGGYHVNPWVLIIQSVKDSLVQRQLLNLTKQKQGFGVWSGLYELPESTINLVAEQSIEPIQQLLIEYKQTHAETWSVLVEKIGQTVAKRTDTSSSA